jgi:hypothetical protein
MKTVAELEAYINGRFAVGVPTDGRLAVTGEPYVVVGHENSEDYPLIPGVVREGMSCSDFGFSEEEAVGAALAAFDAYAEGKTGTLYWRTCPQLNMQTHSHFDLADDGAVRPRRGSRLKRPLFRVYMRLLISDELAKAA